MGRKIYVGNLSQSVGSSNLREWFNPFGNVLSAKVIADRETNRGGGFGFVEMETEDQAQAAILGLNEHEHDGQRLKVDEAKPRVGRSTITPLDRGTAPRF